MRYNKEFEEYWKYSTNWHAEMKKEYAWEVWQASRRDMYRIGEEVQIDCTTGGYGWERGLVGALTAKLGSGFVDKPLRVRRWPVWEPKVGEIVFALDTSGAIHVARISTITNMFIYVAVTNGTEALWEERNIKPFLGDKIGKPWDEI